MQPPPPPPSSAAAPAASGGLTPPNDPVHSRRQSSSGSATSERRSASPRRHLRAVSVDLQCGIDRRRAPTSAFGVDAANKPFSADKRVSFEDPDPDGNDDEVDVRRDHLAVDMAFARADSSDGALSPARSPAPAARLPIARSSTSLRDASVPPRLPAPFLRTYTTSELGTDLAPEFSSIDADADDNVKSAALHELHPLHLDFKGAHRKRVVIPWYVLLPESRPQQLWSIAILVLLVHTIIVMPWRLAFAKDGSFYAVDTAVDLFFTVDIALSFLTAFENKHGRLEVQPKRIAANYIMTWFLLDAVSIFPFYVFGTSDEGSMPSILRLPRLIKLLKMARLLKLLNMYRLRSLLISLEYSPYVHQKLLRICELFLVVMAFAHLSACVWYYLGEVYNEESLGPGVPWIHRIGGLTIVNESVMYRYLISLYWSLTTLCTVGYGDISAQTSGELVFAMITMVAGSTLFAYTTATVASMISERDQKAQRLRDKMGSLRSFTSAHGLSTKLRRALTKRMTIIWTQHTASDDSMAELMGEFPSDLAVRVTSEIHKELIEKSEFARTYADRPNFLLSLFRQLLPLKMAQGEMLAHQGDVIHNWYIVESGELRTVHPDFPTLIQYESFTFGQSLGESGLFDANAIAVWPASVRCISNCRIWMTSAETMHRMVGHFGMFQRFEKDSSMRVQRLLKIMLQRNKRIELLTKHVDRLDLALTVPAEIEAAERHRLAFSTFTRNRSLNNLCKLPLASAAAERGRPVRQQVAAHEPTLDQVQSLLSSIQAQCQLLADQIAKAAASATIGTTPRAIRPTPSGSSAPS